MYLLLSTPKNSLLNGLINQDGYACTFDIIYILLFVFIFNQLLTFIFNIQYKWKGLNLLYFNSFKYYILISDHPLIFKFYNNETFSFVLIQVKSRWFVYIFFKFILVPIVLFWLLILNHLLFLVTFFQFLFHFQGMKVISFQKNYISILK